MANESGCTGDQQFHFPARLCHFAPLAAELFSASANFRAPDPNWKNFLGSPDI
jgi:hypothetical protein